MSRVEDADSMFPQKLVPTYQSIHVITHKIKKESSVLPNLMFSQC
jgi:hypothetical protein